MRLISLSRFFFSRALVFFIAAFFACVVCASERSVAQASASIFPFKFTALKNKTLDLLGGQRATAQDHQGFLWFGGEGGLARYDGYTFKRYTHDVQSPHSLSGLTVRDLLVDSRGDLWVATTYGVNLFDRKNDNFIRYMNNPRNRSSLSHNNVSSILEDQQGNLWFATRGGGINKRDARTGQFLRYLHNPNNANSVSNNLVRVLYQDRQGIIWIGTQNYGLDRFDPETGEFTYYKNEYAREHKLSHAEVITIEEDYMGNLWLGTVGAGIYRFDRSEGVFIGYTHNVDDTSSISSNGIFTIYEDSQNNLWVGTDGGGVNLLDRKTMQFKRYTNQMAPTDNLRSNKIRTIFEDKANGIWFGHFPAGVSKLNRYALGFTNYRHRPNDKNSLSNSAILAVAEDRKGNLWVGTENGLNYLDRSSGKITRFEHNPKDPYSISANAVTAVLIDSKARVWAGTWKGGVNLLEPNPGLLSESTFKHFMREHDNKTSLSDNEVWVIYEDKQGQIWVGCEHGGLNQLDAKSGQFIHYQYTPEKVNSISAGAISDIFEDSLGYFWLGTENGLNLFDRRQEVFMHHRHRDGDLDSLSANWIKVIFEASNGDMWFGTWGGGLNRLDRESMAFESYRTIDGLAEDVVSGILEDDEGNLWLSTLNGLSKFNPSTKTFQNYDERHGLPGRTFQRSAALKTSANELVFGGTEGLTIFKPNEIANNLIPPSVVITEISLFNRPLKAGGEDGILEKSILHTREVDLNYDQSVISLEFSALDFRIPDMNQYAYRLEGFDSAWTELGTRRTATYTNLDAGRYVFRVKGSNNEGVWSKEEASLVINVQPPWWLTWWAYLIYAGVILGALLLFVRSQQLKVFEAQEKIKMKLELVARLKQVDKLKDDFLANTSHELRTPLNGIIGLVDSVIEGAAGEVSELVKMHLKMVSVSGKRLSHLVNDILDLSAIKNDKIQIDIKPVNLYEVVNLVLSICMPSVSAKDLNLYNRVDRDAKAVLADEDRLQQILYNLIGNAIKFTDFGAVEIYTTKKNNMTWVHVKDSGVGIPANMVDKIFDTFTQVEGHISRQFGGSGLGLSVTKRLVELLGGDVSVVSKLNSGSTFSFSLPITDQPAENSGAFKSLTLDSFKHSVGISDSLQEKPINWSDYEISSARVDEEKSILKNTFSKPDNHSNTKYRILIVDDEAINRLVLLNQLSINFYTVVVASSGEQALQLLENGDKFDLVLLDIMMPRMSGYEVCKRMRLHYNMQELPIIFLTAKNLIADLADGFEVGANDFLTKPISMGELSSRVSAHLQLLDYHHDLEALVEQRTSEVREAKEKVLQANKELSTLNSIVASIHAELSFDRLVEKIVDEALTLVPSMDQAAYWKLDEQAELYSLVMAKSTTDQQPLYHGLSELGVGHREINFQSLQQFKSSLSISIQEAKQRYYNPSNKLSSDIYQVTNLLSDFGIIQTSGFLSAGNAISLAIKLDQTIVGFLVLASERGDGVFEQSQLSTLDRFKVHINSALSTSRLMDLLERQCDELENISLTDTLTGLRNRRFFYKYIDSDAERIVKKHESSVGGAGRKNKQSKDDYIFFMVDIDLFKQKNDDYGHLVGDRLLTQFGSIIKDVFRESDYCIRWGGEEFLIVARFCDRSSGSQMAENLRKAVEGFSFDVGERTPIRCTCSIGFACYPFLKHAPRAYGWSDILDVIDAGLYAAKDSQRNIWVGVYAEESEKDFSLLHRFLNDPVKCIKSNQVIVQTNADDPENLEWKASKSVNRSKGKVLLQE